MLGTNFGSPLQMITKVLAAKFGFEPDCLFNTLF